MILSSILIAIFITIMAIMPNLFLNIKSDNNMVMIKYEKQKSFYKSYKDIKEFQNYLSFKYPMIKVHSIINEIDKIKTIDDLQFSSKRQEIEHMYFNLSINSVEQKLKYKKSYLIYIYGLNNKDKIEFYSDIMPKNTKFSIVGLKSQIETEQIRNVQILTFGILLSVFLLSIFVSIIFNNVKLFYYTFIADMIPIVLFSMIMYIFKFEISFELILAVTVSFVLTTDSIIHNNYRYWKSRVFYKHGKEKSINELYIFSIIPMILIGFIIIVLFLLLYILNSENFTIFSLYISIIIFLSMLVDLYLYPLFLLEADNLDE
jgi:hypothetical protein